MTNSRKRKIVAKLKPRDTVTSLRLDAQLAYLDGRVERARQINRLIATLARAENLK